MFNERRAAYQKRVEKSTAGPSSPERKRERDTRVTRRQEMHYDARERREPHGGMSGHSGYRRSHPDSNPEQKSQRYKRQRQDQYPPRYNGNNRYRDNDRLANNNVRAAPLESFKLGNSRWDVANPKLEGISAKFVKSVGIYSSPSTNKLGELNDETIKELVMKQKQLQKLRRIKIEGQKLVGPANSQVSKMVVLKGIDLDKTSPQDVQKFLENFFASTVIPKVSPADAKLTVAIDKEENSLIIECASSLMATALMSFNMKYVDELGKTLMVRRPYEYIEQHSDRISLENGKRKDPEDVEEGGVNTGNEIKRDDPEDDERNDCKLKNNNRENTVVEEIIETSALLCINGLPVDTAKNFIREKLLTYGELLSMVTLQDRLNHNLTGTVFCSFRKFKDEDKDLKKIIGEISSDNKWNCFQACVNPKYEYHQDIDLTVHNIREMVSSKREEISVHQETSTIQLLNAISFADLMEKEKAQETLGIFKSEISKLEGFEKISLVNVPEGFRYKIDKIRPEYGRIFVKFTTPKNAKSCLHKVCGRFYHNRIILGGYVDDCDYRKYFD